MWPFVSRRSPRLCSQVTVNNQIKLSLHDIISFDQATQPSDYNWRIGDLGIVTEIDHGFITAERLRDGEIEVFFAENISLLQPLPAEPPLEPCHPDLLPEVLSPESVFQALAVETWPLAIARAD